MIFKFSDDDNFHKSVTRPMQKSKSCLIKLEGVDVKMTPGRSRRQNNTWRLILFHSNENQPSSMRELRFGDNLKCTRFVKDFKREEMWLPPDHNPYQLL